MRRSRLFVGVLTVGAVVASTQVAPSVGASAHGGSGAPLASAHSPKVKVGGWTQLSAHGVTIIKIPDLMPLSSGGIQVVWSQDDAALKQSVRTRIVKESGKVGSPVETVVQNWSDIVDDPQIIDHGRDRLITWAGLHSSTTGDPLNGPMVYSTSPNGKTWSLGPGSLSKSTSAYASYGTSAVDDGGTPIAAWTFGGPGSVTLHRGIDPSR